MATAGALVGASIAGLAYKLSGQNYTITFALATVPATLALLLTISVRHPQRSLTLSRLCMHMALLRTYGHLQPRPVDAREVVGSAQGASVKGAERVYVFAGV